MSMLRSMGWFGSSALWRAIAAAAASLSCMKVNRDVRSKHASAGCMIGQPNSQQSAALPYGKLLLLLMADANAVTSVPEEMQTRVKWWKDVISFYTPHNKNPHQPLSQSWTQEESMQAFPVLGWQLCSEELLLLRN